MRRLWTGLLAEGLHEVPHAHISPRPALKRSRERMSCCLDVCGVEFGGMLLRFEGNIPPSTWGFELR